MGGLELMNFLSGSLINKLFDVEITKDIKMTPSEVHHDLVKDIDTLKKNKSISTALSRCHEFTVHRGIKEVYENVGILIN